MARTMKPVKPIRLIHKDYKTALAKFMNCVTVCSNKIQRIINLNKEIPKCSGEDLVTGIEMQNTLQKLQDSIQMMNTIQKTVQNTAVAVIRKIGGGEEESSQSDDASGDGSAQAVIRKI